MPASASSESRETRRELRVYLAIFVGILAAGLAIAVLLLAWKLSGARLVGAWIAIPLEMRLVLQLSMLLGGIVLASLASWRAWREWRGRARARDHARETAPIAEFAAGSVTAVSLVSSELFDARVRQELAQNRRKYLVRPKDAFSRSKRSWGAPVLFVEPTRAGDTRLAPVLALANSERRKHQENLQALLAGAGQLSSLRVIVGIGKGYTSLTRAHALREEFARTPAKVRMTVFVTDRPASEPPTGERPVDDTAAAAIAPGVVP